MKRSKFLKVLSSVLGCFAICGFSVFGLLTRSNEKVQSVNAESRIIYNEISSPIDFDLQLYLGSNPVPTGRTNFQWKIGLKYYIDIESNTYNLDISHNVKVSFTSSNTNTFIGTDTLSNIFRPGNNLKFGLRVHSLQVNRNSSGSSLVINYDLLNNDAQYRNTTFTINSSSWTTGGNMSLDYNDTVFTVNDYSGFPTDGGYLYDNLVSIDINQGSPYFACIYLYSVMYIPEGYDTGYSVGYTDGYNQGYTQGSADGYQSGVADGNTSGYEVGYQDGVDSQQSAIADAYSQGYSAGYENGHTEDSTVASIFSGILTVGMLPVNFFLQIFNFEILGINLSAFISAIFTVTLTIIVIKTVTGKGGGGSDK